MTDEISVATRKPPFKRTLKTQGKLALRRLFEVGQSLGVDILPRHYYSEVPDIRQLKNDSLWRRPFSMQGIRGSLDEQMRFVVKCTAPFSESLAAKQILKVALQMNRSDEGYGAIEAQMLYCFIRSQRPQTIVQIGCGVSTAICLLAATDENYQPRITCIEPYPTQFLLQAAASKQIQLIREKAQDTNLEIFNQVQQGDLFFVDSSHTLGPGGEVSRIVLGILPQIAQGAYVHFHDIWFPYDYCPYILSSDLFFQHETPLLYAFLCMNERYSIAASLSQLAHGCKTELLKTFPQWNPAQFSEGVVMHPGQHPSAIYLRA